MKTFARRELVHTATREIRVRLEMYGETEKLKYINSANDIAGVMEDLGIISFKKRCLLHGIIDNEFKRLLDKRLLEKAE